MLSSEIKQELVKSNNRTCTFETADLSNKNYLCKLVVNHGNIRDLHHDSKKWNSDRNLRKFCYLRLCQLITCMCEIYCDWKFLVSEKVLLAFWYPSVYAMNFFWLLNSAEKPLSFAYKVGPCWISEKLSGDLFFHMEYGRKNERFQSEVQKRVHIVKNMQIQKPNNTPWYQKDS